MARGVPARLTAAQGRRFGLTVGGAFLLFALIAWWRDHAAIAWLLSAPGAVLAIAAIIVPTQLGPVERAWMALAHAISKVTTPIVMGIMYVGVLTPVGLLKRTIGDDALVHGGRGESFWYTRPPGHRRSTSLKRQF